MIKTKYILLIITLNLTIESSAQTKDSLLYKKAYDYLNDSVLKLNRTKVKALADNCEECCVKGMKLKFKPYLQVANRSIRNDSQFPLDNFIKSNYTFSNDCLREIRLGTRDCSIANYVQDSLATFWKGYTMKSKNEISAEFKNLPSKRNDGYQVFFSDIYKNTLAAEVMGFCLPYTKSMWQGSSTSYFFVFDDNGNIIDIYSGVVIHYN